MIFLILITIFIFTTEKVGISIKRETNSNDESQSNSKPSYVGDMYKEDIGNYETSIAMASSEKDMNIGVVLKGSDVILETKYLLQCPELFDYGIAALNV